MKIGVWLADGYNPLHGGGYSYYNKLIHGIDNYQFADGVEVCYIASRPLQNNTLKKEVIVLKRNSPTVLPKRIFRSALIKAFAKIDIPLFGGPVIQKNFSDKLTEKGVDLLYYPIQAQCFVSDFPFIATSWDMGHRSMFPFPETTHGSEFILRDHWYRYVLPQALKVFVESEAGKEELIGFTGVDSRKLSVVPLFSGDVTANIVNVDVQRQLLSDNGLESDRYFFYPAQFWAHKNHFGLICAFEKFITLNSGYKLVLTGSDKGTASYIKSVVAEKKIENKVLFLGFVHETLIYTLYKNATALVMPTFLGPTNMPLIEALEIGCPVLCSDLKGHHEILENSAIYFDPAKYQEMAHAMERIIEKNTKEELLVLQKKVLQKSKFTLGAALQSINNAFMELVDIRKCWKC